MVLTNKHVALVKPLLHLLYRGMTPCSIIRSEMLGCMASACQYYTDRHIERVKQCHLAGWLYLTMQCQKFWHCFCSCAMYVCRDVQSLHDLT